MFIARINRGNPCGRLLGSVLAVVAAAPAAHAVNYEVYPGSAFYLEQMQDRGTWSFVATHSNGLYHHPVGFQELSDAQEEIYTGHFTNRFAMVEGDMGSGSTTGDVANLRRMTALGLTPVAAFVNRAARNLAVWRQLVRNNAAEGAPSYEMLAPHRLDDTPLGWNDPNWDYARSNMLFPGCIGSGVDAPVHLFVNQGPAYRQSIYDMRDWTVANGKKFNYLISPNNSYDAALLADTQATVRAMEDAGHEPDVYGVVLYGLRPVDLTPEKVTVNGVDQAATTITGLAYWLLKHRDGEPGTLDLSAFHNGTDHAAGVTSPTLAAPSQVVALSASTSRTYTLRLNNTSPWLDYAGVLRARTHGSTQDWSITFSKGGQDITAAVLSGDGKVLLGADRWMPQTLHEISMTVTPIGSPGPLKLIVEALPHAGVDHALDVISFESGTIGNTAPTLAINTIPQITREALPFGPLWFTCGDAETPSPSLVVTATSSNLQLVPVNQITLGQSGIQRWIRVAPVAGVWGLAEISVTVSDGTASVTKSFTLTVDRSTVLPVVKANNGLNLELDPSWQNSAKPGVADQAVWDATVTGPNNVALGSSLNVAGLRITNPGGDVTIGGASELKLGIAGVDLASSSRDLFLNAPVFLDESAAWNIAANRQVRVSQGMGGFGGLTKSGNGKLELLGQDTFAGPLSVSAGELVKTGAGGQSSTTVSNNALLRVSHSGAFGTGGLNITAANSSTARVELQGGITVLTGRTVSINARSSNTDAIRSLSGDNIFGGNLSLGTGGSIYAIDSAAGFLNLTGNLTSAATGTRNLTLRGVSNGRITGTLTDGSGIVGIIKSGTGKWTLAGTHDFTGPVNHQQGTLEITAPLPVQNLSVSIGAMLSGSGTLGGSVTIAGTHSPGIGVGSQTIQGPLTYQNTAAIRIELAGQSNVADGIEAAGVSVTSGARIDVIANLPGTSVDFSDGFWRESRQWPVLSASTLDGNFILGLAPVDSLGLPSTPFGSFNLIQESDSVALQWVPAPPFQVWQYEHFGDDWNNPLIAGPDRDPDGDGWSNGEEWITGTVPNNPSSLFTAHYIADQLSFSRAAGRIYRVEMTDNLAGAWTTHSTAPPGIGPVVIPLNSGGAPRLFYRVAVSLAP